jgi:hypothetical protein
MHAARWTRINFNKELVSMRKLVTLAVALAAGTTSAAAFADGNAANGNLFVNANLGASHYRLDNPFSGMDNHFSKTGNAGALRFGYRWNSVVDYGFEAGYGYLGNAVARGTYADGSVARQSIKTRGWLLGGNLNYNITDQWYVSARGGWFRARSLYADRFLGAYDYDVRASQTGTGEYLGLGFGYNISKAFSVGVAYDTYRSPTNDIHYSTRIGMYSLQGEYRF